MINYDLDYDKFNVNYDDVYRVQTRQEDSYPINYCTYSPAAFRYHLMQDVPEVDKLLLMREVSGGAHGAGQFFTLPDGSQLNDRITSYNVCYTKLLRIHPGPPLKSRSSTPPGWTEGPQARIVG